MSKAFNRVGAALVAAFSAQQVLSFMQSSIQAYKESEIAIKKLDTALGKNSKSLQKFAEDLQKVTTFSDESTIEAMSLIAAFTKEEDKIKGLIKVTQDFATAKGVDLSSAADLVTKTFASSTNALARYGITVVGAAGSTERYNSLIKALAIYLGQAEAQGKTLAGQMEILNNELNNQQEVIGAGLLPVWVALNKAFAFGIKVMQMTGGLTGGKMLAEKQAEEQEKIKQFVSDQTDKTLELIGYNKSLVTGTFEIFHANKKTTDELKKQVETYDQLLTRLQKYSDFIKPKGVDTAAILSGIGAPTGDYSKEKFNVQPIDEKFMQMWERHPWEDMETSFISVEDLMGNVASLSGQISSTLNIAGHTFVGQLTQAASIGYSILNIISGIISIFSFFSGGGAIGALVGGLEKGGRVRNLGGNISFTKIPSFAVGGSYSTPGYGGPMGGGYPVMVHKNETLDVYNAGQTSRMESKMDRLINAVLTTNVHVSKKGKGQLIEVPVYLDGKEIARASQKNVNRMSRRGVNLNEF